MNTLGIRAKIFDEYQETLLSLLKKHAYEEKPVVLSSGKLSNFYIDCRRVSLTGEGHFLIGALFCEIISIRYPRIQAVGGMVLGAAPLTSAVSTMSAILSYENGNTKELDAFYIRKEPKKHGMQNLIEGIYNIDPGSEVVLLDDVVTSGGSSRRSIHAARVSGLKPIAMLALVDREEGGRKVIEEEGIPLVSLYKKSDFRKEVV